MPRPRERPTLRFYRGGCKRAPTGYSALAWARVRSFGRLSQCPIPIHCGYKNARASFPARALKG